MAVKKRRTQNQKAFQKERRRLLQAINRAKKQGYIFPENIVPSLPKRVTKKSLERIQLLKPKDLYKKAQYLYEETGEIVSAEERKQEVKRLAIEKRKLKRKKKSKTQEITTPIYYPTISIIDAIRDRIIELQREAKPPVDISYRKNEVLNIFDDTVTSYEMNENISEYEDYLKNHESEIADLLNVISYDSNSEKVNASFVSLGRLLNVTSLSMEQAENLSAMAEYYNG
nr:MAG TPA: hypothetical protein [Caudoviricetes sp.]